MNIQPRAFSPSAPGWHRDLSGGRDSIAALLGPSTRSSVPAVLVRMVLSCPLVLCLLSSEIPCWDWLGLQSWDCLSARRSGEAQCRTQSLALLLTNRTQGGILSLNRGWKEGRKLLPVAIQAVAFCKATSGLKWSYDPRGMCVCPVHSPGTCVLLAQGAISIIFSLSPFSSRLGVFSVALEHTPQPQQVTLQRRLHG